MTNRGLRLHLPRLSIKSDQESDEQLFQEALACQFKQNTTYVVGILLIKILDSGDQYIRKDGSLYPIPIDKVQSKIMRNFGLPGAPLENYDYTQDMYKWIYVKKSIQYPKQEDLTSPGDVKDFRVTSLEGIDSTWTVSSYPRTDGNILPIEIAPPQAVKFRWNPEVWSWHAVLLFTETLPTHFPTSIAKGSFYLVIGWNGATGKALEHLGTNSETAQEIHEKYSYGFPEQLRNVLSLEEGYGGVDGEVRISQIEVKSRDGGKEMREVVLNVKLNRPTRPTPSVSTVPESVSLSPQPKKQNWLRKKLMR
ncbi:hypothetical protein NA56DRAFT_713640 [Hyaloscypha hepaticicola]|uniref:Uncharacterized protein n=1 Tax=Hyaloscypha hepaticicola TaxID=2082293 RepID=A0A2J6PDC1_9HELO|nr:hypothetical protein NA56DRAFT_713640 [Hyaloscypha hepaticicola]